MNKRIPSGYVAALVLILSASQAHATLMFSQLVALGDSLSDQGNLSLIAAGSGGAIPPLPPPEYTDGVGTQGRFTNGRNYVDYLSETLNVAVGPSLIGGTNYAVASARTATHFAGNGFSLLGQRDAYLNNLGMNDADPDALHIVWAGANDLNDIITDFFTTIGGGGDPMAANATAATAIGQSVANIGEVFTSLAGKNANTILAPNIPNLGIVPLVTTPFGGAPVPAATALAALFNSLLDQELNAVMAAFPLLNIIDFDIFTLSTDIALDPTSFGFANATDACYSLFVQPGGTTCADPDSYVSWDGFHPTSAAHEVIASRMAALLVPEPATLTLLLVGLGGLRVARRRHTLPA